MDLIEGYKTIDIPTPNIFSKKSKLAGSSLIGIGVLGLIGITDITNSLSTELRYLEFFIDLFNNEIISNNIFVTISNNNGLLYKFPEYMSKENADLIMNKLNSTDSIILSKFKRVEELLGTGIRIEGNILEDPDNDTYLSKYSDRFKELKLKYKWS